MSDGLVEAGDVSLKSVTLFNANGVELDLTYLFLELNLYEDLFSHTMSGTITVYETHDLISVFPLIGEETLDVEFSTPGMDNFTIKQSFSVYKLSDRIIGGDKKALYVLNLISGEAINDLNNKISRAFTGFTHDIAQEIYGRYLKDGSKDLTTDSSVNQIKLVSPYWAPTKCIHYCASKSILGDTFRTPNFMFFETNKKFRFSSLSTLYGQDPKTTYFYDSDTRRDHPRGSGQSVRDVQREMATIQEFQVNQTFDYIERLMNGVYSHKVYETDVLRKVIRPLRYNYWYDFDSTQHLEKYPMASNMIFYDDQGAGRIERKTIVPMVHDIFRQDYGAEILTKRVPLLSQLEMYHLDITVPGRTDLEVGDVVNLDMGRYASSEGKENSERDPYYAGKYMISAILHRITQTKHRMVCQLVKESLLKEIKF